MIGCVLEKYKRFRNGEGEERIQTGFEWLGSLLGSLKPRFIPAAVGVARRANCVAQYNTRRQALDFRLASVGGSNRGARSHR